jgi:hypothetical protein
MLVMCCRKPLSIMTFQSFLCGGEVPVCEYLPHISNCLWIYALDAVEISRTKVSYWLDTIESHCTWCSVCCVTAKYERPLGVVAIVRLLWLRGELEVAWLGRTHLGVISSQQRCQSYEAESSGAAWPRTGQNKGESGHPQQNCLVGGPHTYIHPVQLFFS